MEPFLTDSAGTAGEGMIFHDELHHFHYGHMGRLPSTTEEGGDGDDLMMGLEEEDEMGMGMGMKGSLSPDSRIGFYPKHEPKLNPWDYVQQFPRPRLAAHTWWDTSRCC